MRAAQARTARAGGGTSPIAADAHRRAHARDAELQRGYIRRVWDGGRTVFRYASLTYGAANTFTQPWLAQTVLSALWWMSRRVAGFALYAVAV